MEQVQYTTTYNTDIKEFLDEAKEPEYPVFEKWILSIEFMLIVTNTSMYILVLKVLGNLVTKLEESMKENK